MAASLEARSHCATAVRVSTMPPAGRVCRRVLRALGITGRRPAWRSSLAQADAPRVSGAQLNPAVWGTLQAGLDEAAWNRCLASRPRQVINRRPQYTAYARLVRGDRNMRQYIARWLIAVLIVTPIMFVLVPVAHRLFFDIQGPHANDSLWQDFLNMAGFYGGYVLVAGTAASLAHTWVVRRTPRMGQIGQILWAGMVGVVSMLPQAALFGHGYWTINVISGLVAGGFYGLLVTLLPIRGGVEAAVT